jgi:glycosyltransferase involved in cell wall biosynthesis
MVYPSLYEGFGLPILEGFASRIPVITSSTTSIPEVAGDAVCYVNPLDTIDIAAKMQQLAEDKLMQKEMIAKGLERLEMYSWEKCAEKHLKLFSKITNASLSSS